jgi:hypothetical protein
MRALILLFVVALALALGASSSAAAALVITVPSRAKAVSDQAHVQPSLPRASLPRTDGKRAKYRAFSADDDEVVRAYFRKAPQWTAPPKRTAAIGYALGAPLPDGIAKTYLPLPLEGQLPIYPNASYFIVGRDVVLIDAGTRTVFDILKDVFG